MRINLVRRLASHSVVVIRSSHALEALLEARRASFDIIHVDRLDEAGSPLGLATVERTNTIPTARRWRRRHLFGLEAIVLFLRGYYHLRSPWRYWTTRRCQTHLVSPAKLSRRWLPNQLGIRCSIYGLLHCGHTQY